MLKEPKALTTEKGGTVKNLVRTIKGDNLVDEHFRHQNWVDQIGFCQHRINVVYQAAKDGQHNIVLLA